MTSVGRGVALSAAMVMCAAILTAPAAPASTGTAARTALQVDGSVHATLQANSRTYIGGQFTQAGGRARLNAAAVLSDGRPDPEWRPQVNGTVRAMAVSADRSTIFLGGDFTRVDGVKQRHLAAVDATTGDVVPGFVASVTRPVLSLAVAGDWLYVGGAFQRVNDILIPRLARVSITDGTVDETFAPTPDGKVRGLVVSPDQSRLYAAGTFRSIGGLTRLRVVELATDTGLATPFAPPAVTGAALAVALSADGARLFVSTATNRTYAFTPALGDGPGYVIRTNGPVLSLAASGTELYLGGDFTTLTDFRLDRPRLAAFLVDDGTPTDWRVTTNGPVLSMAIAPRYLSVGGSFTKLNGLTQQGFGRFDGAP